MKIGVLGTGMVGSGLATKLIQLGHDVMMGSRSRTNEKAAAWAQAAGAKAMTGTFADAAAFGELLFNCTNAEASLEALTSAGAANLKGKVLVDVANPLDFSQGFPPSLTTCNTDSLGEQIQRAFPDVKVVKSLNTVNVNVMVNPGAVGGGDHTVFVAGNDAGAKAQVAALLKTFGWKHVQDAGDIASSRGLEAWLLLWVRLMRQVGSPAFNLKIVT